MRTSGSEARASTRAECRPVGDNRRRRQSSGFSLFEMMIALALAASLSVVAITSFAPAASRVRLKAEAAEIGALLIAARTRAITGRTTVRVRVDAEAQTIAHGQPAVLRQLPKSLELAVASDDTQEGSRAARIDIAFYPEGGANGGAFSLSDGAQVVTYQVDWLTGRIATTTGRARAK